MRRVAVPFVALMLALVACAGDDEPEVAGTTPDETADDVAQEPDDVDTDAGSDDAPDQDDEVAEPRDEGDDEQPARPDAAALDDPCADHLDREGTAFVALVAPVDDQVASDDLELVGCSSVPEGTVQYRLLDGDGATLAEGFTTAECGGPCIGAFRETVSLEPAEGEPVVHVQVFWEDLSDGSDRDLEERIVVLG